MRASRPLEVTVAVYPTLVLTNALPYDMDIVVWQVRCLPSLHTIAASKLLQLTHTGVSWTCWTPFFHCVVCAAHLAA